MRNWKRLVAAVLAVAACGALAYWATVGVRRGRAQMPEVSTAPGREAVMRSPEAAHYEGGRLAWKFILDEVELDSGGSAIRVQGPREGLIYDETGKPAVRISARRARGDMTRKDFEISGEVTVTSPRGLVITTDKVQWFNDKQLIRCPGPVVMKAKGIVISTTSLDYSVTTEKVKCPNQVRMYSGNNRVLCKSLTYDTKTGITDIEGPLQMVIHPEEAKQILKELRNP